MTDKEKILAEIERLRSDFPKVINQKEKDCQWLYWRGLNKIRDFINSLPEEPISNPTPNERMSKERFAEACKAACSDRNYRSHYGLTETRDDYFVDGVQWADEHPIKEPKNNDLDEASSEFARNDTPEVNKTATWYCVVAEKKRIFKAGAEWKHKQLEENRLAACDRATKEEIEREQDFCDKIIIGEHRQPTYSDAIEYGIKWQKEQMKKQSIGGKLFRTYDNSSFRYKLDIDCDIPMGKYKVGDKVKIIIIKDE